MDHEVEELWNLLITPVSQVLQANKGGGYAIKHEK